jgi:hypothetical protein
MPKDLALQPQVLAAGRLAVEAARLGDDADRFADPGRFAQDVVARDLRRAAVRVSERGEDLHRRRLARAVRPEQAEDRPRRHREGEAVERLHVVPV